MGCFITLATYLFSVLQGNILHDQRLVEMWSLLRKYTLHVFRPLPDLDPDAALAAFEEASACLWDFSVLAELHFEGTPLCTYNLHLLNCRMLAQQSQRGQTSSYGEWWV